MAKLSSSYEMSGSGTKCSRKQPLPEITRVPPATCPKTQTRKPCVKREKPNKPCVKREQPRKPCKKAEEEKKCVERTTCVDGDGTESVVRKDDGTMAIDLADMGSPDESPSTPPPVSDEAAIGCGTCGKGKKDEEEEEKKSCGPCGQ